MMMQMATILTQKNPMSDCVLTETVDLLIGDDAINAIGLIVTDEKINDYRSITDWLLAVCFSNLKPLMMAFYDDKAPLLKDCFSDGVIKKIDNYISSFVRLHMEGSDAV